MKGFRFLAIALTVLLLLTGFSGCVGIRAGSQGVSEPIKQASLEQQTTPPCAGTVGGKALFARSQPLSRAPVKAQVINVLEFSGTVMVVSGGVEMSAYSGMRLSAGDRLTTARNAHAMLDLNNGGVVVVEQNSELEITQSTADYIEVSLLAGNIINSIEKGAGKYAVKTNNVTMGVLGTVFRVSLANGTAKIDLYEGGVTVTFQGDDGSEVSFDLGEGLSFLATNEAMQNSIENGELETGELDLPALPDDALNWIVGMLEDRVDSPDNENPDLLNEIIAALNAERDRREPAAAPAQPASLPPPLPPTLEQARSTVIGETVIDGDDSSYTNYTITMTWTVSNGTLLHKFGYSWNVEDWNPIDVVVETFTSQGVVYYVVAGVSGPAGTSYSVSSGPWFEEHVRATADGTAKLNVILVEAGNHPSNPQVFDHQTVTLLNKTPEILVSEGDQEGTIDVVVEKTTDPLYVDNYANANDTIEIDTTEGESVIDGLSEEDAGSLLEGEVELYPNGDASVLTVTVPTESESGGSTEGSWDVNIYLPTTAIPNPLP